MNAIYIIAEAGVNHNGQMDLAFRLIDEAAASGADAVKFQSFKAEQLVTRSAPKAAYQLQHTESTQSQYDMLKSLELGEKEHDLLIGHCKKAGIEFLSTPFDRDGVDYLSNLGLSVMKIPSGEITNVPYLEKVGACGRRVFLSTGMCTLGEVETAINVLEASGTPRGNIVVLHCNTEYPTPFEDVNLKAMLSMGTAFDVAVGYSDHTLGIEVPVAAAALGACVIEKHFTLDRSMEGPDHKASLEPTELKAMVSAIRNIEKAIGDGVKRPSPSEIKNRVIARKSIHFARELAKGSVIGFEDLSFKRPGSGISPVSYSELVGKSLSEDVKEDQMVEWKHLT